MEIILISLLVVLASILGTIAGFGVSTIMIPVLLIFLPLTPVLLFAGIIHFADDIWKIILFRKGLKWKLILLFGIPGIFAAYLGAKLIFNIPEEILSRTLGAFLISYSVLVLLKPDFKIKQNNFTSVFGGFLSGFFAGIFGLGGAVKGAFLSSFNLRKTVYIATMGAIAFAIDITRISTYLINGVKLEGIYLQGLLLFIPLSFLGAYFGKKAVDKIPQKYFRETIMVFLILIGIRLLFF